MRAITILADAQRALEAGQTIGKVVLDIRPS